MSLPAAHAGDLRGGLLRRCRGHRCGRSQPDTLVAWHFALCLAIGLTIAFAHADYLPTAAASTGRLVARNNILTNSGPCETNGTVAAIPYGYTADDVGTVKSSVTAGAGAGKLS